MHFKKNINVKLLGPIKCLGMYKYSIVYLFLITDLFKIYIILEKLKEKQFKRSVNNRLKRTEQESMFSAKM